MIDAGPGYWLQRVLARVLADYPLARERLARHQGKLVALQIGPLAARLRIAAAGDFELAGVGSEAPDLAFTIPVALLPRLAAKDETAWREVHFQGDSELASTLSTLAREVEWDVEEDLSRVVGDIAAHRLVGGARSLLRWGGDARNRWAGNVAEYLVEEKRVLLARSELENLARANETLRDDLARAEARVAHLARLSSAAPAT